MPDRLPEFHAGGVVPEGNPGVFIDHDYVIPAADAAWWLKHPAHPALIHRKGDQMAPRRAEQPSIADYIKAHYKVIIGLITVLLVQFVPSETTDWIVSLIGVFGIGAVPNDQGAKARIYPRSR